MKKCERGVSQGWFRWRVVLYVVVSVRGGGSPVEGLNARSITPRSPSSIIVSNIRDARIGKVRIGLGIGLVYGRMWIGFG